jgi:hypothetical protein
MALSEKAARSKDLNSFKSPQLQHRHFAFIASCIRDIPTPEVRMEIAQVFSNSLRRTNPAFDGSRFRDACDCIAGEWDDHKLDQALALATFWKNYLIHMRGERDEKRGIVR